MLKSVIKRESISIHRLDDASRVDAYIVSTPGTRRICNDPRCLGVDYTRTLSESCSSILREMKDELRLVERDTAVVNILRGGLNYGLREALSSAYGWNAHSTCFLSAQRAKDSEGDDWHITENAYRKLHFPKNASLVIGDVVATGTSLVYALDELVKTARADNVNLRRIVFFTYGGPKALTILNAVDERCRKLFPCYEQTTLFYLEGMFTVPDRSTPLSIKLPGTDLLRYGAVMAPEFIESQYEDPKYPIERCIIYDAGSRAFWCREYILDVIGYWKEVLSMAERGVSFDSFLNERFPGLDASRFSSPDLRKLAADQISYMEQQL